MEQVDKAIDLIETKYTVNRISYKGTSRIEMPQFPLDALRESLMNAIAHKDYSTGIPIQISVYPDHITFWNPGKLPEDWTTEGLFQNHPSTPYNPLLANTFFRSGDIESWGRGYKRIIETVMKQRILPPKLKMIGGLMITYYADVRSQLSSNQIDERRIKVIECAVDQGSITNSDVQNMLGVSKATASRILQQTDDWLEMQGKVGKGTCYVPKWLINDL